MGMAEAAQPITCPDPCSIACRAYFATDEQVLTFFSLVLNMAKTADEITADIARIVGLSAPHDSEFQKNREMIERSLRDGAGRMAFMDKHRALIGHIWLTKQVDNFLCYISDLIALIFNERPETFRPPDMVGWDEIEKYRGLAVDELIGALVDKRLASLSQDGLEKIARYLKSSFNFDIFPDENDAQIARRIIEERNLIVHRRGLVDRHFIERVPTTTLKPGDTFDPTKDAVLANTFLAKAVVDIEMRAVRQFRLTTGPRS